MPKVQKVSDLKVGEELSEPVKNKFGQILISANVVLEEKHLKLLNTWGIASVNVKEDSAVNMEIVIDEKFKQEVIKEVDKRFSWRPESQNEKNLYTMTVDAALNKLSHIL